MAWTPNPRVGLLLDDAAHHLGSVAEAVAASAGMIRDGCPAEALRRLNGALDALWVAAHGLSGIDESGRWEYLLTMYQPRGKNE